MWIEYELCVKERSHEKGVFNSDHVRYLEIETHGGGYGTAINLYYDGYFTCIFIIDDDELIEKIWKALLNSLLGLPGYIDSVGFIKPLNFHK